MSEAIASSPVVVKEISSTASLAEALSKAQSIFEVPLKNKTVDFLDKNGRRVFYKYADLADTIAATRKGLSENGLSVVHQMYFEEKFFNLKTSLLHSSGELISTLYPLPDPTGMRAQDFGAALTFARRYSFSAIVGIASDDDPDGAQEDPKTPGEGTAKTKAKAAEKPAVKNYAPSATVDPLDKALKDVSTTQDPADFRMPFGEAEVKGVMLRNLDEKTLKTIQAWCQTELRKSPPSKNMPTIFETKTKVDAFLKSVGC